MTTTTYRADSTKGTHTGTLASCLRYLDEMQGTYPQLWAVGSDGEEAEMVLVERPDGTYSVGPEVAIRARRAGARRDL